MTIDQLIERLSEYRDAFSGDIEVRLMTQPSWPFENTVAGVVAGSEINDMDDEDCEDGFPRDVESDRVVYLVEGTQLGYGSKRAWELI